MRSPPFDMEETVALIRRCNFNVAVAARTAGLSRSTLRSRVDVIIRDDAEFAAEYSRAQDARRDFLAGRPTQEPERWAPPDDWQRAETAAEFPQLPDADPPYEELKARLISDFERLHNHKEAAKLIRVNIKIDGPYGLMPMGDPHIDNPGTDWVLLDKHIKLIKRTEGLFGINAGDSTDNWVGRMVRLYAESNVSRKRAIILLEGFLREVRWIFLDRGNHDIWSGAEDPIVWISRMAGIHYKWEGSRIELASPSGSSVIINSRHDFPGRSQYHPTHGPLKAVIFDDFKDDIYTCGHIHQGGYMLRVSPTGLVSHLLRLSSYKVYDSHKDQKGFQDGHLPACVFVIDPSEADPIRRITYFQSPEKGADYLTFLRRKK